MPTYIKLHIIEGDLIAYERIKKAYCYHVFSKRHPVYDESSDNLKLKSNIEIHLLISCLYKYKSDRVKTISKGSQSLTTLLSQKAKGVKCMTQGFPLMILSHFNLQVTKSPNIMAGQS